MKKWYIMLAFAMLLLSGCGKQTESSEVATEESNTEEPEPATTEALETVALKDAKIGDIVQMGTYEQDGDAETEDPICWDVLDKDGDAVLLISHDVIAYQRFSDNHKCVIWEDSEIRTWLNQEFYAEAFDEEEQASIWETTLENPFSGVNQEINLQSGNYENEALVVDGYVYFYKSRVNLGNYDHVDELKKCGNNVIYRLSPDGTYEEFYTFDYGDAIYYSVRSKLYYYNAYFYIQIGNRIYRIDKEGTRAQVIYENMGEGSLAFGIRDHYLVLQKARQYYCLNLDKWDWSQPIEVGHMRHLLNIDTELFDLYEGVIYGSRYELSDNAVVLLDHQLKVWNEEEKELEKIASDVYCLNVYKGDAFYAQSVDDGVCIKYRSFDGESEVELFTINQDENKRIKSLVVSDDFIIYDLGPGNYEDGVDMRVIWNRNTGETQEEVVYR